MANRNPRRSGRKKGTPKTGGRKRGTPNKATLAVRDACARIVEDAAYQRNLLARACAGELAPAMEALLWHYRFGKPKDRIELEGTGGGAIVFEVVTNVPQPEAAKRD